jgi:hypothetical protein
MLQVFLDVYNSRYETKLFRQIMALHTWMFQKCDYMLAMHLVCTWVAYIISTYTAVLL